MKSNKLTSFCLSVILTGLFVSSVLSCVCKSAYECRNDDKIQRIMVVLILLPVIIGFIAALIAAYTATD